MASETQHDPSRVGVSRSPVGRQGSDADPFVTTLSDDVLLGPVEEQHGMQPTVDRLQGRTWHRPENVDDGVATASVHLAHPLGATP